MRTLPGLARPRRSRWKIVKRALAGELDTLLEAETQREPFRRLVR